MTEAEQRTKPYLQHLPDDPGGQSYEELLKLIEQYFPRSETNHNDLAKLYAGLKPEDETSEAIPILDELIDTDYYDAMSYEKETSTDELTVDSIHIMESSSDESIDYQSEHAEFLYMELESAREEDTVTSYAHAILTALYERFDDDDINLIREIERFVRAWWRGEPLAKAWYRIEWIQEYCRTVFDILHPEVALRELIAIRKHYGDENDNHYGCYRIGRMIAGCHAALGQFDKAKSELRSTAYESFEQMRRYTDLCLAFGFHEDLIGFMQASVGGERHLTGGYATAQMIMAYEMLGRIDDALPHLKARVNVRVRDQQLIDNIWSLKLRTGDRPTGSEVLSVQRSKLRTFGKKNMEMVAKTVDVLLEVYARETGINLLQRWSKECHGNNYVSNLRLISIPGLHNVSTVLRHVKERNLRYYIETDLKRYSFIDNRSVKSYLADIVRLAEDLTKAAGRTISAAEIGELELESLTKIKADSTFESLDLEAAVPAEFLAQPLKFKVNYRPSRESIYRFKELTWLIPQSYAKRKSDLNAIDETIRLCEEQINLFHDMAHYDFLWWRYTLAQRKRNSVRYENDPEYLKIYLQQARDFRLSSCIAYKRLAIILEKKQDYASALRCVVRAKTEGQHGDWDKRILRLLKKMSK